MSGKSLADLWVQFQAQINELSTQLDAQALPPGPEPPKQLAEHPKQPRRYVRRDKARGRRRGVNVQTKQLKHDIEDEHVPHVRVQRPLCRADCEDAERPCPFVGCKHHLYLDVNQETGTIKFNFPDIEPWEMKDSCALDVAERGGITLEEVGEIINLTRERVRQIEVKSTEKLRKLAPEPHIIDRE